MFKNTLAFIDVQVDTEVKQRVVEGPFVEHPVLIIKVLKSHLQVMDRIRAAFDDILSQNGQQRLAVVNQIMRM